MLEELAHADGVPVHAYCLMPDHVHLLIAVSGAYPLPRLVQRWKSMCYRERRRLGNADTFWQRSFHDRAVRRDEDLRAAALYALNNPVRAGLVKHHREYPLCGSLEWELD